MLEIGVRKWVVWSLGYVGMVTIELLYLDKIYVLKAPVFVKMQYFWMIPWKSECMHFALLVHRRTVHAAGLFHTLMICFIYRTTVKCQIWLQVKWHPKGFCFEQTFCEHAHVQHAGNDAGCIRDQKCCFVILWRICSRKLRNNNLFPYLYDHYIIWFKYTEKYIVLYIEYIDIYIYWKIYLHCKMSL